MSEKDHGAELAEVGNDTTAVHAPELPHDAPLLEWQVIRYGDSPETHAALAYYRERGWAVDDPNVHPNYDRVNDFISAFKSGYRAAIQKAEGR